jgi:hypothetical protein
VPSASASALLTLCVRTQALLCLQSCKIHEAPSVALTVAPKPPPRPTTLAVISARSSVTHVVLVVKLQDALHVSFAAEEAAARHSRQSGGAVTQMVNDRAGAAQACGGTCIGQRSWMASGCRSSTGRVPLIAKPPAFCTTGSHSSSYRQTHRHQAVGGHIRQGALMSEKWLTSVMYAMGLPCTYKVALLTSAVRHREMCQHMRELLQHSNRCRH